MIWIKRIGKILGVLLLLVVLFLASLYRPDFSAEEVNAKYLTPESQFIEVGGIRVHVRIMGEGEPIFLLHGSFASLHTWEPWQQGAKKKRGIKWAPKGIKCRGVLIDTRCKDLYFKICFNRGRTQQ